MAKSTCSTSSNSSYSSGQSASTSSSKSSSSSSSTSHSLGLKSGTDRRKRLAANARERKRMNLLNQAYDRLRKRLVDAENKSKYDVLVQAKEYIQALSAICENMDRKEMPISTSTTDTTAINVSTPMLTEAASTITTPTSNPQFPKLEPHHYPCAMAMTRFDQMLDYV